jgi:WD40 repeat protein
VLIGIPTSWESYKLLRAHVGPVLGLCFSPDGRRLVSGPNGGALYLWETRTGACIARHSRRPAPWIHLIAFTPDGKRIVTNSKSPEALLWDGETGQFLNVEFRGHEDLLTALTITPCGRFLVTGSQDHTVRVWSLESFESYGEPLLGHTSGIHQLILSACGHYMASAAEGECAIWDMQKQKIKRPVQKIHDRVTTMLFTLRGSGVLTCGKDGVILLSQLDLQDDRWIEIGRHESDIICSVISTDGTWALSADDRGTIRQWDLINYKEKGEPRQYDAKYLSKIVLSPDQRQLILITGNATFMICDIATGQITAGPFASETGSSIAEAISPDHNYIATANLDGNITLWNLKELDLNQDAMHMTRFTPIDRLELSPDHTYIATYSSSSSLVRLWNANTGIMEPGILESGSPILCIAFSQDNNLLATGSEDRKIRIWEIRGKVTHVTPISAHEKGITALGFSKEGDRIVSGSRDMTLNVWNVDTGEKICGPFTRHEDEIVAALYRRNHTIVSTSREGTTMVWDPCLESATPMIAKHFGRVNRKNVILSHDEQHLVCATTENTLEFWKLEPQVQHIANYRCWESRIDRGHFYFSDDDSHLWYQSRLFQTDLPNE